MSSDSKDVAGGHRALESSKKPIGFTRSIGRQEETTMRQVLAKWTTAIALLATTLSGCTDLTEAPYNQITEANFQPTASDIASLIAPVYTPLRASWMSWYGMVDWQGETADILLTPTRPNGWYDGGIYVQNHQHRWNASSPGMANGRWGDWYSGINAANRVTYQIESNLIPIEDDALRTTILAELRGMRAYYYSLLLDNFGNVPIVTDFTSEELPEQNTRQEVYDFVVSELNDVIPRLSDESGQAMHGRMNQWAARGILARVYLNAEVYTGSPQWDNVIALTQEVIESGRYQLDATYRGPFSRTNENSPELVFAVPYDATFATQSNFHMKTLKPDLRFVFNMNAGPWGGSASNPQWIDTYDPDDGRLVDTWLMGPQFDGQGRGYEFLQHVPAIDDRNENQFFHGFPVWKYEIYAGMTGASDVDYPAVRYADILMMQAEALLRTGQAGAAAALVTSVRQRNFTNAPAKATVTGAELMQGSAYNYGWYDRDGVVKTGPGGSPVQDGGADIQYGRFLDELGWEFAAEGQRRQQLIRFGVFTTKAWYNHTPNGGHVTIFPIPQARLDTNSKLTQNPGY